jgi:hypothetical protein
MAATEEKRYTGDLDEWVNVESEFVDALDGASPDARAIALAIRAGLAELAVDVSRIRAFGAGSSRRSNGRRGQ